MIGTETKSPDLSAVISGFLANQEINVLKGIGHDIQYYGIGKTNRYAGKSKPMASKKLRRESDQINMLDWKPRHANV